MKKLLLILLFSILSFASTLVNNSVVKIFTTTTSPNYLEPWENPTFSNYIGSGVIIKDNQILTSAHVVSGGKFIEVQKENGCFMNSLPIKEMSTEESDYYWDLVLNDEIKAENYRMKFFTSLQNDSNKEILEICNFKILQAFEDSFSLKISEINHNGDKNLKNEIIYFINNNKEFQSIVKLRT